MTSGETALKRNPGSPEAVSRTARGEFTWMVGGQQGEGIDSTGDIVAKALHRQGYFVYGYRHFASRIKGGHTNYSLRIGTREVRCGDDGLDLLIALDRESIEFNRDLLDPEATVLFDSSRFKDPPPLNGRSLIGLPLTEMAKEAGGVIMRNTVAVGATAAVLGLPVDPFGKVIAERFGAKGKDIVGRNRAALESGYERARTEVGVVRTPPTPEPNRDNPRLYISGNEAVALGALMGGCRFLAAYPITPATEIMYRLIEYLPRFGGTVVQCEDEIAAVNMAIGANYAGVRAMTSTSGPGLSLMTEALSLTGMVEVPLVVVDVQRAGPATGLPTKTEQGDLNHLLFGSHGEFPRVVFAPRTAEDCFAHTVLAFDIAERYQCPVLIATDLTLGMSSQTIRGLDYDSVSVDRPRSLSVSGNGKPVEGPFLRYRDTPSGISPRALPGMARGRHLATGDEHDEGGRISEDPRNRVAQMNKRLRKLSGLDLGDAAVHQTGPADPDLLIVGWGSTFGALAEIQQRLSGEGYRVAHLQIGVLWPLPVERIKRHLAGAARLLIIEHNATGQLHGLLRREISPLPPVDLLLKYDGNPLRLIEVDRRCREVLRYAVR